MKPEPPPPRLTLALCILLNVPAWIVQGGRFWPLNVLAIGFFLGAWFVCELDYRLDRS